MEAFETFEVHGVKVELHADYDAGNPYDSLDQASRIVGFEQLQREGFSEEPFPTWEDRDLPVLARWLTLFGGEAVAIPFTFTDFGSSGYQARLVDVGSDRAAGFVCVSRETAGKEWPESTTIDGETFTRMQMAERCARAEFETWAAWLEGDVCGYVVAAGTPEEDSCWGFYGPDADKYAREEATAAARYAAFERDKREQTHRMYLLGPAIDPAALTFKAWETAHPAEPVAA